jgi:hypothetical protein
VSLHLSSGSVEAAAWGTAIAGATAAGVTLGGILQIITVVVLVVVNLVAAVAWLTGVRRDLNQSMSGLALKIATLEAEQKSAASAASGAATAAAAAASTAAAAATMAMSASATLTSELKGMCSEMRQFVANAMLEHIDHFHARNLTPNDESGR